MHYFSMKKFLEKAKRFILAHRTKSRNTSYAILLSLTKHHYIIPNRSLEKITLYMTNSYLINLFRGEPLKNCSVDRLPDILARQYQVVQTVGYLNLRHIRAKTFAIF